MRLLNTLSRRKEEFVPIHGNEVRMYTCGPTVYDLAHIGNFRTFVFEDILRRYLRFKGYRVIQVMNITDIDDKTIAGARREGVDLDHYTARYIDAFFEDLDTLGIERAEYYPRATEHVEDMVRIISALVEGGYAYQREGSVYFSISKFSRYGDLSGRKIESRSGVVDDDEYGGEDARDFVLWKGRRGDEPSWEVPFGRGRPGWHIECSAMSMKYLGPSLDIHAGGVDNIFPHHENEIAQSETYTGKRFVKYWLHAEHLLVEGEKMAKSKGNFYTLRDLIKRGYDPRAIRFCLASSYYRRPLNFTLNGLEAADSSIQRIEDCRSRVLSIEPTSKEEVILEDIHDAKDRFIGGMDDDLNSPRALSSLFEMIRDVNRHLDSGASISLVEKEAILDLIGSANGVFDFLSSGEEDLPERVMQLIDEREEARAKKDYQRADVLREEIARNGFILEDTPRGVRWKRISSL